MTELLKSLTATVAMEDRATRRLLDLLGRAVHRLDENGLLLQDLVPDGYEFADDPADDPAADEAMFQAEESAQLAEELGRWIGDLSAALIIPADQRQAIM